MSLRELIILGTASQVPTRYRNHNGYFLRWDTEGLLFDPGEGTQRQLLLAGVPVSQVTRICVTHFHGDHCLGLPGVIQRRSVDRITHPVDAHFPAGGGHFFTRLRYASSFYEAAPLRERPISRDGERIETPVGTLEARRLRHPVETYGYRLVEPDSSRMLPDRLAAYGIRGPAVGELIRAGHLDLDGHRVTLDAVSEPRRGQRFAFVMDTGLCEEVFALAEGADLLVIESTFLTQDAALAAEVGHLTAAQAARVAQECGVRRLVLTHFSQRYSAGPPGPAHAPAPSRPAAPGGPRSDLERFAAEAREHFTGDLVIAEDLMRVKLRG